MEKCPRCGRKTPDIYATIWGNLCEDCAEILTEVSSDPKEPAEPEE